MTGMILPRGLTTPRMQSSICGILVMVVGGQPENLACFADRDGVRLAVEEQGEILAATFLADSDRAKFKGWRSHSVPFRHGMRNVTGELAPCPSAGCASSEVSDENAVS